MTSIDILNPLNNSIIANDNHSEPVVLPSSEVNESGNEYINRQIALSERSGLRKDLEWPNLIGLGVGMTIGAGIFVLTGVCARDKTGPALFLSFIVSGIVCLLSALSYAEFAGMAPTAGSAYGFTRATLGPFMGWVVGWDLVLEYAVTGAGVAQGWSKYCRRLIKICGGEMPLAISTTPWSYDPDTGKPGVTGSVFDLLAVTILAVCTLILIRGIKESTYVNNGMVVFKVLVVLFVILVGMAYTKTENYSPFMPYGFFGLSFFGYTAIGESDASGNSVGVLAGASVVFFAYIGFDGVTTCAEECKNPQRDLPIGIIGSLAISTVLYVALSIVLVGMVPYKEIDRDSPVSSAFGYVGLPWAEVIVTLGALAGLTSVLMMSLLGQPRILMAMARDGLLPKKFFTDIHPVYRTPHKITALIGVLVSVISSLIPLTVLVELVSMGTLMAFALVNISVIRLRYISPDIVRPFRCPCFPYIPGAGAVLCLLLMLSLPSENWFRLIGWFGLGMIIYYNYGRHHASRQQEDLVEADGNVRDGGSHIADGPPY